jgi:16S rRNA (adenine1518-N6/adenine1519-N6)-dimethyltransferase
MIKAKKSLGQHFLVDTAALKRIAEAANICDGDEVIEIGPGTGLLTKELLPTGLQRLIAYEVDDRAVEMLREEIHDERFEVRHEDFLEAELGDFYHKDTKTIVPSPQPLAPSRIRVIGNIPYYITSPIIFKLIDDRRFISDAVLLVQLEVAERLTAEPRPKAYGIPTVLANFFGEVEFLFKVKAGSFRPVPKVDSAVIRIDFERGYFVRNNIEKPAEFDEEAFRKLVRTSFGMRRKTLRNNLKTFVSPEALERLEAKGYLSRRAEELSVDEFVALYKLTC